MVLQHQDSPKHTFWRGPSPTATDDRFFQPQGSVLHHPERMEASFGRAPLRSRLCQGQMSTGTAALGITASFLYSVLTKGVNRAL